MEGGGGREQSDISFDLKCSSGYTTSDSKSFQSDNRGPRMTMRVLNLPQVGLKLPT